MSPLIQCNHWTRATWRSPGGRCTGYFEPDGSITFTDDKRLLDPNMNTDIKSGENKPVYSARIFVPLSNGELAWTADNIVAVAKKARDTMDECDGWVICYQTGRHSSTDGNVNVEGDGLQLIIIDAKGDEVIKNFEEKVVHLCEILARELGYKQLVLELQQNGLHKSTVGVAP